MPATLSLKCLPGCSWWVRRTGDWTVVLTQESTLPTTQSFVPEFCFLHPLEALSEVAVACVSPFSVSRGSGHCVGVTGGEVAPAWWCLTSRAARGQADKSASRGPLCKQRPPPPLRSGTARAYRRTTHTAPL